MPKKSQTQTKELTAVEQHMLNQFYWFYQNLTSNRTNDHASKVVIDYDPEYDDFAIETNEPPRRNGRTSRLGTEIINWAYNQVEQLERQAGLRLSTFVVGYADERYRVAIGYSDTPLHSQQAETVGDELGADELSPTTDTHDTQDPNTDQTPADNE